MSQTRNFACGFLPVQGALTGSLGKHGSGVGQSFAGLTLFVVLDGGANLLDGILHAGTGGAIAACPLQALLVTLEG